MDSNRDTISAAPRYDSTRVSDRCIRDEYTRLPSRVMPKYPRVLGERVQVWIPAGKSRRVWLKKLYTSYIIPRHLNNTF